MAGIFNFGGPGWFNDVFDVEIRLDSARHIALKGFLLEQNVPLYRSDEKVTGKIVVKSPPNRTVSHYGIQMELESSIQFYETLNSVSVSPSPDTAIVEVQKDGSITGVVEIPFELDLSKCKGKDGAPLLESYDGEKFDVRHSLLVTIKRPWYTFNVTRVTSVAIQTICPAPSSDAEARAVPTQLQIVSRVATIEIDDCGGSCVFAYGRSHFSIGDTLMGTISFSQLEKPVSSVKLLLYKIEVADGETQEKSIKELAIVSPSVPKAPEGADAATVAAAEAAARNTRTDAVKSGEEIPIAFLIAADEAENVSLGPTYDELNDAENPVNVHHYIRLMLEDVDGKKSWNTHEVILYRKQLSGLSAIDV